MEGTTPYLWIAGTVLYTAFAVSVTAVVLSLSGPGPLGHPLVIAGLGSLLGGAGVLAAYHLSGGTRDGGDGDPPR